MAGNVKPCVNELLAGICAAGREEGRAYAGSGMVFLRPVPQLLLNVVLRI